MCVITTPALPDVSGGQNPVITKVLFIKLPLSKFLVVVLYLVLLILFFLDCSCVGGPDGAAFNRTCESDCINDTFFLITIFVTMILLFLPTKPILTIISDSAEDEGSLPLAVQGVAYKILGTSKYFFTS